MQALQQNVQQELYAKIVQRFALQCKLSNDDISRVVEERLLRKTQPARQALNQRFSGRSGEITDLGTLQHPQRVYPVPNTENFALFYPFLPWTVAIVPDVVKGIAQAAGREEALTGSNRTMIGVVQGAILDTPGLLQSPVGRLVSLADLYDQVSSDVPIETKTDLNRVQESVPDATNLTGKVARALFLLGQAQHVPTTCDNVARALVDGLDAGLTGLTGQVKIELEHLVNAGYAKQVGEEYFFLSTQQRTFQDKVRSRQQDLLGQNYELSQALREYDSEDALRFDRVALQGREIPLKLEIDGRTVRNPAVPVTVRVFSPLQRTLDPQIGDDTAMRQRSSQDQDAILLRLAEVPGLRSSLALAIATDEVAGNVIRASQASGAELDVARQARQVDLPSHKTDVRRLLGQAVRGSTLFFRGTTYQLAAGDGPGAAVRATLAELLPRIYTRYVELPYRLANEETAVKVALAGNTANGDLQALGVFRADGTLNESHALLSALRGRLPLSEGQDQPPINADALRSEFERPPFGWDGNCIKVGSALLLRASTCRLIENGRVITDPTSPEVAMMLAREQRFKNLRVQGVRSELGIDELMRIRGYMEPIFGLTHRPALVAATLHNILGDNLASLQRQAQALDDWATTAQCPMPLEFEAGTSVVADLLNSATLAGRLPVFLNQADRLIQYHELLQRLTEFQREQGATFLAVRDFFNTIVNANLDLPEVQRFIQDWRTVTQERSVAEAARWHELTQAHHNARLAVNRQIESWQVDARQWLAQIESGLEQTLRAAGVPEARLAEEMQRVAALQRPVTAILDRSDISLYEARSILSSQVSAGLELERQIQELRQRYQPAPPPSQEVRLSWQVLAGQARISFSTELEQMLNALR